MASTTGGFKQATLPHADYGATNYRSRSHYAKGDNSGQPKHHPKVISSAEIKNARYRCLDHSNNKAELHELLDMLGIHKDESINASSLVDTSVPTFNPGTL